MGILPVAGFLCNACYETTITAKKMVGAVQMRRK